VQYPDDVRQDHFSPAARLAALNNEAVIDGEQSFRWLNGAGPLTLEVDIMPLRALELRLDENPFTLGPGPRRANDPIRMAKSLFRTSQMMTLHNYVTVRSIKDKRGAVGWIALDSEGSSGWSGVPEPEKLICAKIGTGKDIIFALFLEIVNSRDSTYRRVGAGQMNADDFSSIRLRRFSPKCDWERSIIDII
jgi:hypothetical protein